jgi:hypothetical protein
MKVHEMKRTILYLLTSVLLTALVHAQPPNNDCWDVLAVDLTANSSVTVTGNNEGATDNMGLGVEHVWEAFTITECLDVTVAYCGTVPVFNAAHRTLYVECSPGGFANNVRHPDTGITQTDCLDGNFTIPYFQLPPGTYYYLVQSQPGSIGDYQITFSAVPCAATVPANDECTGAVTLVPNTDCITVSGNVDGANAGTSLPPITCEGWTGDSSDDVWFKFVATATSHTVMVMPSAQFDATVDLRSGPCGATENIACSEIGGSGGVEIINATNLTPGETYFVRVYDWWSGLALSTTFDICVLGPSSGGCDATAGTLVGGSEELCLSAATELSATPSGNAVVPDGYSVLYVLTMGQDLVIQAVGEEPLFEVTMPGLYTLHTLVYDETTLDLSIVEPGTTTGADVHALLIQGGGTICGSLDVAGAVFNVVECEPCDAFAGTLTPVLENLCLQNGSATLEAIVNEDGLVPDGYVQGFVLTQGAGLIILDASLSPSFTVNGPGIYTIHSLVYDPATLDLSIIEPGVTPATAVLALIQQGGGNICASLDVEGAAHFVSDCTPYNDMCGNAQPLNVYETGDCAENGVAGTTIFATTSAFGPTCDPSNAGYADVWYVFNSGGNDQVFIDVDAITITSWGVAVYMDCDGVMLVACEAEPAGALVVNTLPDTDYFVMVYTNLQSGQTGEFSICLTAEEAVNFCLGGSVSTNSGETAIVICSNAPPEPITFVSAGVAAQNYAYIITDEEHNIIDQLNGNTMDFTDAPLGTYHIYGVSFNGTLLGVEFGNELNDLDASGDCISISENFVLVSVEFCTGVQDTNAAGWNLYPNPARDQVTIASMTVSGDLNILVHNTMGSLVSSRRVHITNTERITLDLGGMAPGLYTITVEHASGRSSQRLVLE